MSIIRIKMEPGSITTIPAGTYHVTEGGLVWELLSCPDTGDRGQEPSPLPDAAHQEPEFEYHSRE